MTDAHKREQDARFDSSLAWTWWPLRNEAFLSGGSGVVEAECIDSSTGFAIRYDGVQEKQYLSNQQSYASLVSTSSLLHLFAEAKGDGNKVETVATTLKQLRALKREVSPQYEAAKDDLLSKHRVFRQWRRREYESNQI